MTEIPRFTICGISMFWGNLKNPMVFQIVCPVNTPARFAKMKQAEKFSACGSINNRMH